MLSSTDDFLAILRDRNPEGLICSLDVESLFTNVPVTDTINIICDYCYRTPDTSPPIINEEKLRRLLTLCTKEAPFRHINGTMYRQVDGVAMGSALGVTFANYYMAHIENTVISDLTVKPKLYARYVDDCFLVVEDEQHLELIRREFQNKSVLKFTKEISINNRLNFLDVAIDSNGESYVTSVYRKETNKGHFMNARGECPERYKVGMIRGLIDRTHKISSSIEIFNVECNKLKQLLINNGYSNSLFDCVLKKYVQQKQSQSQETPNQTLDLFYRNQMTSSYKIDEKVLKNIIKQNIKCTNENESIKLNIYYKNRKVSNLVMKNSPNTTELQRTNILYKYECNVGDCEPQAYIGYTRTTLSRRITMHLQSGAPLKHSQDFHNSTLNREQMVSNTSIIRQENDFNRLEIMEALYIKYTKPEINLQITGMGRTLRLLGDKDTCQTTNSRIQHPALAVTTANSPALPNTL